MKGQTHLVLGLAGAVFIARVFALPHDQALACVIAGGAGGLLPDIDHPRATISKYAPGVGPLLRLFISHRGITHSLLFVAIVAQLLAYLGHEKIVPAGVSLGFMAGLLLHLLGDMLTPDGIPLLMPLTRRSMRLLPYPLLSIVAGPLELLALAVGIVAPVLLVLGIGLHVT